METVLAQIRKKMEGFEEREGQLGMLNDVMHAFQEDETALIEAGTGTGKSLAYLIPALLWAAEEGEATVIATHTIALQEQLLQKDIPFLKEALGLDLKVVLVKGMQNYICLRKLYDIDEEVPETLLTWVGKAQEGSRSELPVVPSNDLWEQIHCEGESCTHVKCPHYKECFFFKARREAADAHLLVANHHLFFADLSAREESENYSDSCVLPPYRRLILDEAHHVEDVATEYFAKRVSRRGLVHFLGRLISDRNTGKLLALHKKIFEVYPDTDEALRPLLNALELDLPVQKRTLMDLIEKAFWEIGAFINVHQKEEKLRLRQGHLQDDVWLNQVQPAVEVMLQAGKAFIQGCLLLGGQVKNVRDEELKTKCEGVLADISGVCNRLQGMFETFHEFVFVPLDETRVRWIEGESPNFRLIAADLEIAPRLSTSLFTHIPTVVLCSATLATGDNFSFVKERLGITDAVEQIYESPFNYAEQALLAVPIDLPPPTSPQFTEEAAERIFETLEITQGGAFVLFTSYSMLRACERLLASRLSKKGFHLFCQGDGGRSQLLRSFRETDRAVLFGTDSFWEGVDVVGDALRCVILVKLPFKVPSDPLFQARSEAIAQKGGSPFFDYSLPSAVVKFKQGFGRLIRNKGDRGCVVCLDPRIVKKGYGKLFLSSLPDCPNHFEGRSKVKEILKRFYAASSDAC